MRLPRSRLPASARDPAVVVFRTRRTKNAERGGLRARRRSAGRHRRGGRGGRMRGPGGMFAHRRLENGPRVGIALAAKLVEFRDLLLEQAALGNLRKPGNVRLVKL